MHAEAFHNPLFVCNLTQVVLHADLEKDQHHHHPVELLL